MARASPTMVGSFVYIPNHGLELGTPVLKHVVGTLKQLWFPSLGRLTLHFEQLLQFQNSERCEEVLHVVTDGEILTQQAK